MRQMIGNIFTYRLHPLLDDLYNSKEHQATQLITLSLLYPYLISVLTTYIQRHGDTGLIFSASLQIFRKANKKD